jgi:hypothetical protein
LTADGRAQAGMGVAAGDYDRDGWLDIVKTNFDDDTPSLYRNLGAACSTMRRAQQDWLSTRDTSAGVHGFLDVDLDSWPDILIVNGHVYPEADRLGGTTATSSRSCCIAISATDASRTCRCARGRRCSKRSVTRRCLRRSLQHRHAGCRREQHARPAEPAAQLRAPAGHGLLVELVGTRSNRSAIGARVTVSSPAAAHRRSAQRRQLLFAQRPADPHGPRDPDTRATRIEVAWPSGAAETISGVDADQLVVIREGSGVIRRTPLVRRALAAVRRAEPSRSGFSRSTRSEAHEEFVKDSCSSAFDSS